MVTTSKPLSVMGLAGSDPSSPTSSRARQKNDGAGFAGVLKDSTTQIDMTGITPAISRRAGGSWQADSESGLLHGQVLAKMGQLLDGEGSGLYKRKGLEAIQAVLAASSPSSGSGNRTAGKVETPVLPAERREVRGIALERERRAIDLPDRGRGIPLQMTRHVMRDAPRNVALNRTRPATESLAARRAKAVQRMSWERNTGENRSIGALAARFESGSEGIAAIGYDRSGGTSYGKYQIASRPGTMKMFLAFLDREAPDLGVRLKAAGPANTGSRQGEMPRVWKEIAAAEPERFEDLQERFIRRTHYQPALSAVRRLGYKTENFSSAMQEVLWSTAVQHGPAGAARIFSQAAEKLGKQTGQEHELIREVYALRAERFGSSSARIQAAARNRMETEKNIALAMAGSRGKAV